MRASPIGCQKGCQNIMWHDTHVGFPLEWEECQPKLSNFGKPSKIEKMHISLLKMYIFISNYNYTCKIILSNFECQPLEQILVMKVPKVLLKREKI